LPILNYTTSIAVDKTVGEIQKVLSKGGATAIQIEYGPGGNVSALRFCVPVNDVPIYYNLPANVPGITAALKKQKVYKSDEQSARVAWRILKDWVEAQMAIVEAQIVELPQVFLPYAQTNNGQTVYQRMQSSGFKMLEGPKS